MPGTGKLCFGVIVNTLLVFHLATSSAVGIGFEEHDHTPFGKINGTSSEEHRAEVEELKTFLMNHSAVLAAVIPSLEKYDIFLQGANVTLDETNATWVATLFTCEAKLVNKETQVRRAEADLRDSRAELARKESELATKNATLLELMRIQFKVMSTGLPSTNVTESTAHVPNPKIYATMNHAANLTCDSEGRPLSLCMWSHTFRGKQQKITVMSQHGGHVSTDGIQLSSPANLNDGKCEVNILSVGEEDLGLWTCALVVAANSHVLNGEVELSREPDGPAIYFTTHTDGVKRYSLTTSQLTTMWHSGSRVYGIALDTANDILYWTSENQVYRASIKQTEPQPLRLDTPEYGLTRGLAFDWIANNLYVVTDRGYILVCSDGTTAYVPFLFRTLLSGQGMLRGITIDPNEGTMYYSRKTVDGSVYGILKAGTDGSNPTGIVKCSEGAYGIQIDYKAKRLYWAEYYIDRIRSSDLDGGDVVTIAETSAPYGIALVDQRIYWGEYSSGLVYSISVEGTGIRNETNAIARTRNFVYSNWNPPKNRSNDCEQQSCGFVCVLSRTSFKCLA